MGPLSLPLNPPVPSVIKYYHLKFGIFSICAPPPPPRTLCAPQLQSTCHYVVKYCKNMACVCLGVWGCNYYAPTKTHVPHFNIIFYYVMTRALQLGAHNVLGAHTEKIQKLSSDHKCIWCFIHLNCEIQ